MTDPGLVFYKLSGSGNDFVFLDGRTTGLDRWTPERIRAVCARGTGVGADGVVLLESTSSPGTIRFHFFNSDGNRAAMCGNAALCATRLAAALEMAPGDGMSLETDGGLVSTRCLAGTTDRAELSIPDVTDLGPAAIEPGPGESPILFATVGVPHLVVQVADLEAIDLDRRGRELRCHPEVAPAGANVNFVASRQGRWAMRTFERGVEGETLACGTGAVACAAALAREEGIELPWEVLSRSGSLLVVSGTPTSSGLSVPRLQGEGRIVYRGLLGV